nr:ATP-dependent DNA helicase RecG [Anaerolineae bacterium]
MASSLQTLIKILRLEQQKHCQNNAVIGGFARFAYHWSREAHSQAKTEAHHDLVDEIALKLRAYETLAQGDRPAALEEIIAMAKGPVETAPDELLESATPSPALPQKDPDLYTAPDDIGIGELDEDLDEDESAYIDADIGIDAFGTFEHDSTERPVRERRGYKWQQPAIPLSSEALAELDLPVTTIDGVGTVRAEQLGNLGVGTIRDLLYLFPRRHDDYSRMKPINKLVVGEEVTVIGVIERVGSHSMRNGGARVEAYLSDGSGYLRLNWFNQPWMEKTLESGEPYVASGTVEEYLGRFVMNTPELEPIDRELLHAGRIVPVYPLTKGLSARILRRLVKDTIDKWTPHIADYLPLSTRENSDLMDYGDALAQIHFPDTQEDLAAAKFRFAFDSAFLLQIAMLRRRHEWQSHAGIPLWVDDEWVDNFLKTLPFAFTNAQQNAVNDIRRDMAKEIPMNRLLQGDVGSGKTAVAATAVGIAVVNGTQAAIMTPTSILAEQHYATLSAILAESRTAEPESIALLTGNLSQSERDRVYQGLASGSIQVVIGTHALIQPGLAFHRLGLAVIDEQHRFGVTQRGALRAKADGGNPHLLVMTATPIPRTLALTLHADLDLTVLDEMPPGRTPIHTRVLQPKERERAYQFVRGQIENGRQAYVICPLVDESDRLDARSAVGVYERLQNEVFPDLRVGLVHGQLAAEDKEAAMQAFYNGQTDILVSTTVIEVGIDVANATVIVVEDANRFGLAQLHQLRGRVGRGSEQSYCLLIADQAFLDEDSRLKAVESTSDGFKLAEIDWEMRGAGDLLGTRQSGFGQFAYAELLNPWLIDLVQREARLLFDSDPTLESPDLHLLSEMIEQATAIEDSPSDFS